MENSLGGEKISEYQQRIRQDYSFKFYNNTNKVLSGMKMFKLFFNNIHVEGVENVKAVEDKQLFYVSNHLSLADFLMQGHIFWKENLPIPRWIAGENLNKFPFGKIWKKCGAYYLDRNSLNNYDYMRVYNEEIKNGLRNNENLLVYAEGGRNYTGDGMKKLHSGTIGQVVEIVDEGKDIWFVPCFVDYDKRIEENVLNRVKEYKKDLLKLKKNIKDFKKQGKETRAFIEDLRLKRKDKFHFSWDFWAYIQRTFSKDKGDAYLRFGEALSIDNFLGDVENRDEGKIKKLVLTQKIKYELTNLSHRYSKL